MLPDNLPFNGKQKKHVVYSGETPMLEETYVYDTIGVASVNGTKDDWAYIHYLAGEYYHIKSYHTFLKELHTNTFSLDGKLLLNKKLYYTYNPRNYMVSNIRQVVDNAVETSHEIKYNVDFSLNSSTGNSYLGSNICLPIEETFYKVGKLTKKIVHTYWETKDTRPYTLYTFYNTGNVLPSVTAIWRNPLLYHYDILYSNYSPQGCSRELKTKMGQSVVFLWGYNHRYIIAQITNATLDEMKGKGITFFEAIENKPEPSERDWRQLFGLRSLLPHAAITFYKYKPLVGLVKQYDSSGKETEYIYDDVGRLSEVVENINDKRSVIRKYEYKYATGK